MKCEICRSEKASTWVILPIKHTNGFNNTITCLNCAQASDTYCKKHQMPHLGFCDDNTTACIMCIEEMIVKEEYKANDLYDHLMESIPSDEFNYLTEWALSVSSISADSSIKCIFRAITAKALRLNVSIEIIIDRIVKEQSISLILPKFL